MKEKHDKLKTFKKEAFRVDCKMSLNVYVYVCVLVCVSEMDSLWPGRINSLPDWLQQQECH